MKLDEGDRLIGVATCREGDDLLLATRRGRCIRFQITDDTLRVFAGRDSSGVRGIRLGSGDEVMSLSVLRHVDVDTEERLAYLKWASARRRGTGEDEEADSPAEPEEVVPEVTLSDRADRRPAGSRGVPADRYQWRFRQAQLGLRVPRHRPRRPGHRQYRAGQAQWRRRGRHLPGAAGRRRHADDRRRAADPRAGRPGAHYRPAGDGRDAVPHEQRRASDQRIPGPRGGRQRRRSGCRSADDGDDPSGTDDDAGADDGNE